MNFIALEALRAFVEGSCEVVSGLIKHFEILVVYRNDLCRLTRNRQSCGCLRAYCNIIMRPAELYHIIIFVIAAIVFAVKSKEASADYIHVAVSLFFFTGIKRLIAVDQGDYGVALSALIVRCGLV